MEINHIDEIIDIAVASSMAFSQLNLTIDAFKNTIGNVRLNEMNNPSPMCSNCTGEYHKCWNHGIVYLGTPLLQKNFCCRFVGHCPEIIE